MEGSVAIIGTGMMGSAILKGLVKSHPGQASDIIAVDVDDEKLRRLERDFGITTTTSVSEAITRSSAAVLAVKPWVVQEILREVGAAWPPHCTLLSIAAGVKTEAIERHLPAKVPVVRAMPNTPALIGSGVSAITPGKWGKAEDLDKAREILGQLGTVVEVAEKDMDAVTGLSGSGPAYVYLFIEALIDAGVREGLTRSIARQLAVETVMGASQLVKETGEHPAVLKDAVTTPGGTTISGLSVLEAGGFRGLLFEAVREAAEVSRLLGKDDN